MYFFAVRMILTNVALMVNVIYNKDLRSLIYIFVYMLAIADQTAGPNWLTFFEGTHLG